MNMLSVLTVIFIVLKILNIINWSWGLVLLPTIIQLSIMAIIGIIAWIIIHKANK